MIIKGFAFVVGASFYIIQFLFGIGMILGSLLIWFGDNVDWLKDVNYENIGITEKVLMTCFGILVGKNCIKNLFGKD